MEIFFPSEWNISTGEDLFVVEQKEKERKYISKEDEGDFKKELKKIHWNNFYWYRR